MDIAALGQSLYKAQKNEWFNLLTSECIHKHIEHQEIWKQFLRSLSFNIVEDIHLFTEFPNNKKEEIYKSLISLKEEHSNNSELVDRVKFLQDSMSDFFAEDY